MSEAGEAKKVWHLRRLDLFAALSEGDVAAMAALLDDHHLPAGVDLLGHRQRDQVFLVKEGAVRISVGEGRRAATVALLGPGRLFGLSATIGEDDPTISATTVTPSYVCTATWSRLLEVLVRHPQVLLQVTRSLAQQVFRIETWRERLGTVPPRGRLAALLVELSEEFGEPTAAGRRIPFRLTRADLARMIGAARETTSRLMAEFERAGWLGRDDGRLVVRDRAALTAERGRQPDRNDGQSPAGPTPCF